MLVVASGGTGKQVRHALQELLILQWRWLDACTSE
jgi:hypothetical protein